MNNLAEQSKVKGIHTFRTYDMESAEAQAIEEQIQALISRRETLSPLNYTTQYQRLFKMLQKFKVSERVVTNLVTTAGRSVLAQRLSGTTTYTGTINYGALGTGSSARTNGDTQLGTEVFRKVVASSSYTTNVAFIDFFYSKADTNGTYNEFGTFIDGTGSANTGQMFTSALTGGWVKSSSVSMTVSCQYTFS